MSLSQNLNSITFHVIKRDGTRVSYDPKRIEVAVTQAFEATFKVKTPMKDPMLYQHIQDVTFAVTNTLQKKFTGQEGVTIEQIQTEVKDTLKKLGFHEVEKTYEKYQEARQKARGIQVILEDNTQAPLDMKYLEQTIQKHCQDLSYTDFSRVLQETKNNLHSGMSIKDVNQALIMASRSLVEKDPEYSTLTARFLLNGAYGGLYQEACSFLNCELIQTSED